MGRMWRVHMRLLRWWSLGLPSRSGGGSPFLQARTTYVLHSVRYCYYCRGRARRTICVDRGGCSYAIEAHNTEDSPWVHQDERTAAAHFCVRYNLDVLHAWVLVMELLHCASRHCTGGASCGRDSVQQPPALCMHGVQELATRDMGLCHKMVQIPAPQVVS